MNLKVGDRFMAQSGTSDLGGQIVPGIKTTIEKIEGQKIWYSNAIFKISYTGAENWPLESLYLFRSDFEDLIKEGLLVKIEGVETDKTQEATFQAGDVVQLKSGGPLMTVKDVRTNYLDAIWFDADLIPHENQFNIKCLRKMESKTEFVPDYD